MNVAARSKTLSWGCVPLETIVNPTRPITYGIVLPGPDIPDGVPYVRVVDIQDGAIRTEQLRRTTAAIAKNYQRSELVEGDLLVSIRGHVGRTAIVPRLAHGANITQDTARVAIGSEADPRFIRWFIESPTARQWMARHTKGIAVTGINLGDLRHLPVPSPPRSEQQRIANIIDKADAIRHKRQEAIALTEQLLRSTFLEMFGDPVTNPKRWPVVTLGDAANVRTGKTPSRDTPANYGGTVPWVKTTEVRGGIIASTEEHLSDTGLKGMEVFPKGSILIAMYGQGATRGRVAVLGMDATTNQACAVLIPRTCVHRNFLWTYLQLSYEPLRELGRGGNQPNLNLDLVRSFPLPLPPISAQQTFSNIHSRLTNLLQRQAEATRLSEVLFNSLVQRAFTGQL